MSEGRYRLIGSTAAGARRVLGASGCELIAFGFI
jgi:hypothetical protein